jgi:replicative DNA helicase
MGPREMMQREISAITAEMGTGVEYRDMSRGSVSPHDVTILRRSQAQVPKIFMIVDSPNLTVDDVRRHIYALRRESNVVAVFIDYLQIMKRPPASGRNDTAVLGEMTSALKQIARATGVSIILLSQLSRGVESRDDKRPMLSDLRESGSIEQDADAVLFPYREAYYLERENTENMSLEQEMNLAKKRNKMDVLCLKNRRGSIGTDEQVYYPEYDYITDKEGAQ